MRKATWICAGFSFLSLASAIVAVAAVLLPAPIQQSTPRRATPPVESVASQLAHSLKQPIEASSLKIGPDAEGRFAVVEASSIRLFDSHGNAAFEVEVGADGAPLANFWGPSRPRRMGSDIAVSVPAKTYASITVDGAKMINGFFMDMNGWRSIDMPVTAPRKMTIGDIPRD